MNLFKTSLLTFISTVIKVISGIVINKAVAVYVGSSGLAIIGQFRNFVQISNTVASGAINQGVVKYSAQSKRDTKQLSLLFSTSLKISLMCSLITGILIIGTSKFLSFYFLKSEDYTYVFIVFGFTVILFVLNNLILSILNGLKEISAFIIINIIQSIYSLIFTTLFVVFFGLHGALIALATNQSIIFFVVIWKLRNHHLITIKNFRSSFDRGLFKKLLGYTAMALTSAAVVPISQIIIRNNIGNSLGWEQAGYWQAIWQISTMYLMVITTALRIYYLPKLAETFSKKDIKNEILYGYLTVIPIVIGMALVIFFLKDFIVVALFSSEFSPMKELFGWQLSGDVIKMMCFLLGNLLQAKAMIKAFIVKEVIISATFVIFAHIFIIKIGLVGVTQAYFFTYFINFLWLLIIFRMYIKRV